MSISTLWTRENIAWAAGLFEGEGSIVVGVRLPSLSLAMTDEDVVRRFHKVIGLGSVGGPYSHGPSHHKPQWRWSVGGHKQTQAVLAAFWGFLHERRRQKAVRALTEGGGRTMPNKRSAVVTGCCSNGHEMTEANSYRYRAVRRCKACMRAAGRRFDAKQRQINNGYIDVR